MIIDGFSFFNELDVLEVRLNALAPYVDKFVICESPITHSGKPKPLFFQENKERYKKFNIVHLICDKFPFDTTCIPGQLNGNAWRIEKYQRGYLWEEMKKANDEDILLLGDCDEIPDLTNYKGQEGVFKMMQYYYGFNGFTGDRRWNGTIAVKKKNLTTIRNDMRVRNLKPSTGCGGWHFSTLGSVENIIYKMESFAHTELDAQGCKEDIIKNRQELLDPYSGPRRPENFKKRQQPPIQIQMPSGPKWLLENKDRYPHLWLV